MNYYYENNKLILFNKEVVEEKPFKNVEEPFCLDEEGQKLFSALNQKFKIVEGTLIVGKSKIKLLNEKPPRFDLEEQKTKTKINLTALKNASRFTSKQNTRPALLGVMFAENGTIVSTDSYQVFSYTPSTLSTTNHIILSPELVKELIKYDGICDIEYTYRYARVYINDIVITGRLLTGEYPNVLPLFERESQELKFNKDQLEETLKIGVLLSAKTKVVILQNNQVTIKGLGENTNEITQDVELELDYEKKVIAYDNFKLAIDVVDNYSIQLGEENRPIIVLNENTKCLLLPMRSY